jgi:hypothetical protein
VDLLAQKSSCARDIPFMKQLGVNAVYVLAVYADQDHSNCMRLLEEAGIYALFITNLYTSRARLENDTISEPYDYLTIKNYEMMIDGYEKYPNTLGFVFEYEEGQLELAPRVKSWMSHFKAYVQKAGHRKHPIGISSILGVSDSWSIERANVKVGKSDSFSRP